MSQIRVLHMIPTLGVGGAEKQLISLLRSMDRVRFDHQVAIMTREGILGNELKEAGYPIHHFHFRYRYLPLKIMELKRFLQEQQIDVLHTHLHMAGVWGRVAASIAGTPVTIYTEHAHVRGRSLGWRLFERLLAPATSLKITVSEARRLETIQYEHFPGAKVVTIRNSVPVDDYKTSLELRSQTRKILGIAPGDILVGNVSVLRPKKRLDELLRAIHRVHMLDPRVRLIIVGDGRDATRLKHISDELEMGDVVRFLGTRTDVPALMQAMDIYAITSEIEGVPINLLEAMASSLPVVSSSVGGIPEVLQHGETGLLFEYGNGETCVQHLLDLANHPEKRQQMGDLARAFIEKEHSSTANAKRIEEYYISLLREAHPSDSGEFGHA